MKYIAKTIYGTYKIYSDYKLADVKRHLNYISLTLEDFKVDEANFKNSDECCWLPGFFDDTLWELIPDLKEIDNQGNWKYDTSKFEKEIFNKIVVCYEEMQEKSIDDAWELYTKNFSKVDFEMLLVNLADEYSIELEEDEEFDVLEKFFELDNSELIELLDLDSQDFLRFRDFSYADVNEIWYYNNLGNWLENEIKSSLKYYLNEDYEEEIEEVEEDDENF